jgi:6-phosphogluconolactonase (cycloisomerase 2 family)
MSSLSKIVSVLLVLLTLSVRAYASDAPGAVFAITNAPAGNAVVMYARDGDGALTPAGSFPTGGSGTGASLSSQGAVIVSDDQRFLFAVNAGSNSISSFRIGPDGLSLADTIGSGGVMPTSLTFHQGLLYVLNAGAPNNISGFTVSRSGKLSVLAGSTRPLSAAVTSPAQVGFSDDGNVLVVTERATNQFDVYQVQDDGLANGPVVRPSAGPTPYGFAIDKRNTLFVSEAGAGGGASSYEITGAGDIVPVNAMVMTGQRAACWAVVTKNGRYGYVINAGTGNISGFAIGHGGAATLLNADGETARTGGNPTDAAMSHDGQFLYVRVAALNAIAVFHVNSDGSLTPLTPLTGIATGLAGLAAF